MGELQKDHMNDLKLYGEDPFINIKKDEKKLINDLIIYDKYGWKHHFNPFHELIENNYKTKIQKSFKQSPVVSTKVREIKTETKNFKNRHSSVDETIISQSKNVNQSMQSIIFCFSVNKIHFCFLKSLYYLLFIYLI